MQKPEPTHLSPAQYALQFLQFSGKNVFLTGKAGTGKTTFLKNLRSILRKRLIIAAPTGIAALNAGGVTLHSQFQLPFAGFLPEFGDLKVGDNYRFETLSTLPRHMQLSPMKRKTLRMAELLVIDEVSMLRADILDAVDLVLKSVRKNREPFGGVQVLFIGDLMQLPPVVKRDEWEVMRHYYSTPFFFDAVVLRNNPPVYIELDKIYRQSDPRFTEILNHLRYNSLSHEDVSDLNRHYKPGFNPGNEEGFIRLTTHNADADEVNTAELEKLTTPAFRFNARISGEFPQHIYPCDPNMTLKDGAQVMFIKNDPAGLQRFYNGKIARVSELTDDSVTVRFEDGTELDVELYTWENIRYSVDEAGLIKEEVVGTFMQYPLRLAWAITIHKSQGLTFEKALIDIEKVFASGQSYVALSRLRSLNGLVLTAPLGSRLIQYDPALRDFERTAEIQGNLDELFSEACRDYAEKFCIAAFDFSVLQRSVKDHLDSYSVADSSDVKLAFKGEVENFFNRLTDLRMVGDRFRDQLRRGYKNGELYFVQDRIAAAVAYFEPQLREICGTIFLKKRKVGTMPREREFLYELEELDEWFVSTLINVRKTLLLITAVLENAKIPEELWLETMDMGWRLQLLMRSEEEKKQIPVSKKTTGKKSKGKTKKETDSKKGETYRMTLQLLKEGKNPEEIALERNLAVSTIEAHLVKLISEDMLDIFELYDPAEVRQIMDLVLEHQEIRVWDMRENLPDPEDFRKLKLVYEYMVREEMVTRPEKVKETQE